MSSFRSVYMYIQCTDLIHLQWREHRFMILTSFCKTSVFHLGITIFRKMVATVCFMHVSITITSLTFQCKIWIEQEEMPCQPFHSCLLEPFHSDVVLTFFLSRFKTWFGETHYCVKRSISLSKMHILEIFKRRYLSRS